jgi:hypothetical protein
MTQDEWIASEDTVQLLELVQSKSSDRKLRLYFCAGCRQIAHLFYRTESLAAVEVAERFADDEASEEELWRAAYSAECPTFGNDFEEDFWKSFPNQPKKAIVSRLVELGALSRTALDGGEWRVNEAISHQLLAAAALAEFCALRSQKGSYRVYYHIRAITWPDRWLLDCIFGNPFRPLPPRPEAITPLAERIYAGEWELMPLLGEWLQEHGCWSEGEHCLDPKNHHVKGCWVVDWVTGRE